MCACVTWYMSKSAVAHDTVSLMYKRGYRKEVKYRKNDTVLECYIP